MSMLQAVGAAGSLALQLPAVCCAPPFSVASEVAPDNERSPVVLVHGYAGTDDVWRPLRTALAAAGFGHVVRVRYNSLLSKPSDVAAAAARVALDALATSTATGVHLVGHSLGGLIVREAVEADELLAARVRTAVTIASPHAGAPLGRLAPGQCRRVLRRGGTATTGATTVAGGADRVPWLVYYSDRDRLVPPASARLDDVRRPVRNVLIPGAGHLTICRDARLIRSLVGRLLACDDVDAGRALLAAA